MEKGDPYLSCHPHPQLWTGEPTGVSFVLIQIINNHDILSLEKESDRTDYRASAANGSSVGEMLEQTSEDEERAQPS